MMNDTLNDADRWEAVSRRDATFDGEFYYAVRTTGVYCRPSCGARLAHRENVQFFATATDAEAAGFRACKRCRPNDLALSDEYTKIVEDACRAIESADELPSLATLAGSAGKSQFHFHRIFKKLTGVTPKAYAAAHRAGRMRAELAVSPSISEAIYDTGFNSSGSFYKSASDMLGMSPKVFRKGGAGVNIKYVTGQCWLGTVIVASTDKGICSILLGDDAEVLVADLHRRFKNAKVCPGDDVLKAQIDKVIAFVETPARGLDLPLDVQGTAFQQRVWSALQDIQPGRTATYSDIAEAIGRPTASRAVATACASNLIAVAIPCHRVVRADGSLSGYRWGVDRKRNLLHREKRLE
jgi:AraC family transcriptional regulator of adaptative response/methylated-DNA-[protein]-cysteine methyltransferase